jgi:putative ABC transport system permease protein
MLQDVRYAIRSLLRTPGLAAVGVISLALGIGANTAIFSVINALVIKSLPYVDPDRLVLIWGDSQNEGNHRGQVSATDVADFRAQNNVFEDVTTYGDWSATLIDSGEPERVLGMQVGDGYFNIVRATPLLGRFFTPEEQEDGKDFVIVLGYGLWRRRFGGDPNVVGEKVSLSGRPYTVVGVASPDLRPLPTSLVDGPAEFYRPVAEKYDEEQRSARHLRAIARLKPNVSLKQAQSEMSGIAAQLEQQHPENNSDYGLRLVTIGEDTVGGLKPTLWMLLGAVFFVLLIACSNVGNLLLSRMTARRKEIAIRAALGASTPRLVRQLLTESVVLAAAGGGLGLLLAMWGISSIGSLGSHVFPALANIRLDSTVLAFTAVVSLLSGVIFGLAPAIHSARPNLVETLKEGARGSGGLASSRLRNALVVSEIAMALVLLISASLLIRSVMRLRDVSPGFDGRNLLTMNVWLPGARYPRKEMWPQFYNQLTQKLEELPGVEAAGMVSVLPFGGNFDGRGLAVEDQPKPRGQEISVDLYISTPGYQRAMKISLTRGRLIEEQDGSDAPMVALINQAMARGLWPGQDPIGKRIKFPGSASNPQPWRTIVGVVGDVKQRALDREEPMQIYLPEEQFSTSAMTLVVRTKGNPAAMMGSVRERIRAVDKDQAVFNVATMDELLADSISLRRFSMFLLGLFAVIALTLAAIGIYGVISYSIAQRTREIGIRMALGARRRDVVMMVVTHGVALALGGVAIGLVGALGLTRLLSSLLFEVTPTDTVTFVALPLLLTAVAAGACLVPARRATRVDPMVALRYE